MISAQEMIAELDRGLKETGEMVTLSRPTLGPNGEQTLASVDCLAHVSGYNPDELIAGSGLTQRDRKIIMSPSEILAAQWPGNVNHISEQIPQRDKGDVINTIRGPLSVMVGNGIFVGETLVRIEIQARGK